MNARAAYVLHLMANNDDSDEASAEAVAAFLSAQRDGYRFNVTSTGNGARIRFVGGPS